MSPVITKERDWTIEKIREIFFTTSGFLIEFIDNTSISNEEVEEQINVFKKKCEIILTRQSDPEEPTRKRRRIDTKMDL